MEAAVTAAGCQTSKQIDSEDKFKHKAEPVNTCCGLCTDCEVATVGEACGDCIICTSGLCGGDEETACCCCCWLGVDRSAGARSCSKVA